MKRINIVEVLKNEDVFERTLQCARVRIFQHCPPLVEQVSTCGDFGMFHLPNTFAHVETCATLQNFNVGFNKTESVL